MPWRVSGEYLENCSCDLFCPCLLGPRDPVRQFPAARPTAGWCDIPAVFHVRDGDCDGVALGGHAVVLAIHIPGRMSDGDWRVAPYLPAGASAAQRDALADIFLGRRGGPISRVASVVTEWAEPRVVPIAYEAEGTRRRVRIPDVLDIEVEGLIGADGRREIWIENIRHMAARRLAAAIGRRGRYTRDAARWNHDGKNAHYGPFDWAG